MTVLCDTQAVVCWLADELPTSAAAAVDRATTAFVSVVSLWEIAIKRSIGKLDTPDGLLDQLKEHSFTILAIAPEHALAVAHLPLHHRDPFDRLLVVQALALDLPVVTANPAFGPYGVPTVW